jgi:3-deoxy-manno-octulosonate cytidylyltransferase (CMP-KDO synthetase)
LDSAKRRIILTAIVAIPARLKSTRFPRKVLADIFGQPMLWHVYQAVIKAQKIEAVWILSDSQEVLDIASTWGAKTIITSEDCPSGTDRIASVMDSVSAEIIVNVQADEPLIDPAVVDRLVEALEGSEADVATPVYQITNVDDLANPNVVKVVRAQDGSALYFSRSAVPYVRDAEFQDWLAHSKFWGHAGVYAYRNEVLRKFPDLPTGTLERVENLEQLRLMESGARFLTLEIDYRPQAVDVPEDLDTVKKTMQAKS